MSTFARRTGLLALALNIAVAVVVNLALSGRRRTAVETAEA